MIPYFLVFGILVFFSIFEIAGADKSLRFWAALCAVILILLFAGLRNTGTGPDSERYVTMFLNVPDVFSWLTGPFEYSYSTLKMEPLYILLGSTIRLFTDNYIWLFLVVAAIAVSVNSYNYFKYSPYVILSLILYFSHTFLHREMNQIRAGLASAIALFSIEYMYRKKFFKFSCVIGLASLFHFAALLLFLGYIVNFLDLKKRTLYIILAVSLLIGLIGVSPWLIQYLPDIGVMSQKIQALYESEKYGSALGIFDITNIKLLFFSALLIYFKDVLQSRSPYYKVMLYLYLTGTVWRVAFSDFSIFAARIATFFTIVEVILLPFLVTAIRQRIFAYCLLLAYAFSTLYLNLYIKGAEYSYKISINILEWLRM